MMGLLLTVWEFHFDRTKNIDPSGSYAGGELTPGDRKATVYPVFIDESQPR